MSFSKHFNFFSPLTTKNIGYTILKVFLDNPYSINSFQHLPNVPTIHHEYCCTSTFKNFNNNLNNHLLEWN